MALLDIPERRVQSFADYWNRGTPLDGTAQKLRILQSSSLSSAEVNLLGTARRLRTRHTFSRLTRVLDRKEPEFTTEGIFSGHQFGHIYRPPFGKTFSPQLVKTSLSPPRNTQTLDISVGTGRRNLLGQKTLWGTNLLSISGDKQEVHRPTQSGEPPLGGPTHFSRDTGRCRSFLFPKKDLSA